MAEHLEPYGVFDEAEYQDILPSLRDDHDRVDVAPTKQQKLGKFTIVCLILNRSIGENLTLASSTDFMLLTIECKEAGSLSLRRKF